MDTSRDLGAPTWAKIAIAVFIIIGTWYFSQDTVCEPLAEENLNFTLREMHKDYLTPAERVKMDRNGWLLATYCRSEYAEASKPSSLDVLVYEYNQSSTVDQ